MSGPIRVLMVCTGNICRSPTAEAVLRHLAERAGAGRRIEVDSAGTTGYHVGEPPDRRSQTHARQRGLDLSGQRARQVARGDFAAFDWVIAMDQGHLRTLRRTCPLALQDRIHLLMSFADDPLGGDVPDPYYGGEAGFEEVLDRVGAGCHGLLTALLKPHGTSATDT